MHVPTLLQIRTACQRLSCRPGPLHSRAPFQLSGAAPRWECAQYLALRATTRHTDSIRKRNLKQANTEVRPCKVLAVHQSPNNHPRLFQAVPDYKLQGPRGAARAFWQQERQKRCVEQKSPPVLAVNRGEPLNHLGLHCIQMGSELGAQNSTRISASQMHYSAASKTLSQGGLREPEARKSTAFLIQSASTWIGVRRLPEGTSLQEAVHRRIPSKCRSGCQCVDHSA
eukprot:6212843-Pleurochrysis_carterae.AAC.2